jgi:large subunit ribosomal protein L21
MTQNYAIVETGGKQYKVAPGQKIDVDALGASEGENVELFRVLLISDGENTVVGNPTIDGARVIATCLSESKDDKVIAFKYKPKVRYRRKKGHRQLHAKLEIKEIVRPGGELTLKKTTKKKAASGGKANGT